MKARLAISKFGTTIPSLFFLVVRYLQSNNPHLYASLSPAGYISMKGTVVSLINCLLEPDGVILTVTVVVFVNRTVIFLVDSVNDE